MNALAWFLSISGSALLVGLLAITLGIFAKQDGKDGK